MNFFANPVSYDNIKDSSFALTLFSRLCEEWKRRSNLSTFLVLRLPQPCFHRVSQWQNEVRNLS